MEYNMPEIAGLVGLLKCTAALRQLPSGDTLCFTIRDTDVYEALIRILRNDGQCRLMVADTPKGRRMRVTRI
jgi:hypothetical protein